MVFFRMGSRQAGIGLRMGRANKLCILVFLSWIERILCYGPSAQEDCQFMEKTGIFPGGSMLVLNCRIHCSSIFLTILSWARVCPYQALSSLFVMLAVLCMALESLCVGPFLYPGVVQECFPNEIPISNNKEGGIAIWMSCLSRIKWTPK